MLNDIENLKKCPISLVKREMQMKTTEIPPYKDKLKGQHVLVRMWTEKSTPPLLVGSL